MKINKIFGLQCLKLYYFDSLLIGLEEKLTDDYRLNLAININHSESKMNLHVSVQNFHLLLVMREFVWYRAEVSTGHFFRPALPCPAPCKPLSSNQTTGHICWSNGKTPLFDAKKWKSNKKYDIQYFFINPTKRFLSTVLDFKFLALCTGKNKRRMMNSYWGFIISSSSLIFYHCDTVGIRLWKVFFPLW